MAKAKIRKANDETQTPSELVKVRAALGKCLPLHYQDQVIFIDDQTFVEIDPSALKYEARIQFEHAITDKTLEKEL